MFGVLSWLTLLLACQVIQAGDPMCGNSTMVDHSAGPYHTINLPEGYTVYPDYQVAYKFYTTQRTWNEAREFCREEGASLPIVDSFEKNRLIVGLKDKVLGVHTGVHRFYNNVDWISIKTNKPPGFIPWIPNANVSQGSGQCLALWGDGTGVAPWNCGYPLPVICEIPIVRGPRKVSCSCQVPCCAERPACTVTAN